MEWNSDFNRAEQEQYLEIYNDDCVHLLSI